MKRLKYRLSAEEFERLIQAARPVRYMVAGGMPPSSPQESANAMWCEIGRAAQCPFDGMTVQPDGDDPHNFTAVMLSSIPPEK